MLYKDFILLSALFIGVSCSHDAAPDLSHTIEFESIEDSAVYILEDSANDFNYDKDVTFHT